MRLIYILLIFFFIHSCSNPKKDVVSILPTSVSNFDHFDYADSLLNQYYISYINREIVTENIVQAIITLITRDRYTFIPEFSKYIFFQGIN